eukprot:CAMPEP_0175973022 /NCGR_PEP_ID=MMETSP0108-20121206/42560_1 /TAXON_ID=195067 ORGANISM="Goniomonas pacifica, Strain CCMP1869" /NCGR_SAMPLE_ID=MMETSP0108 /ASSEMBLY_ACC=CAM_ASM_000204 /LENGTH=73 /DNA_ID=CAMNT_0017302417 /DNA_START=8 /DNA_END=226 /DNA_ORIENTATION=+
MIPPPDIRTPIMPELVSVGLDLAVGIPAFLLTLPTFIIGFPFMIAESVARGNCKEDGDTYSFGIFAAPIAAAF